MPFIAAALYLLTYIDKLSRAWKTPTKWYPIPIAVGALVLVAVQWRKQKREEPLVETQGPDGAVIRAEGPWQVSSPWWTWRHWVTCRSCVGHATTRPEMAGQATVLEIRLSWM